MIFNYVVIKIEWFSNLNYGACSRRQCLFRCELQWTLVWSKQLVWDLTWSRLASKRTMVRFGWLAKTTTVLKSYTFLYITGFRSHNIKLQFILSHMWVLLSNPETVVKIAMIKRTAPNQQRHTVFYVPTEGTSELKDFPGVNTPWIKTQTGDTLSPSLSLSFSASGFFLRAILLQ